MALTVILMFFFFSLLPIVHVIVKIHLDFDKRLGSTRWMKMNISNYVRYKLHHDTSFHSSICLEIINSLYCIWQIARKLRTYHIKIIANTTHRIERYAIKSITNVCDITILITKHVRHIFCVIAFPLDKKKQSRCSRASFGKQAYMFNPCIYPLFSSMGSRGVELVFVIRNSDRNSTKELMRKIQSEIKEKEDTKLKLTFSFSEGRKWKFVLRFVVFWIEISSLIVCLFGVFRPTGKLFTQIETLPLPVMGCKFAKLCSELMAIEQ